MARLDYIQCVRRASQSQGDPIKRKLPAGSQGRLESWVHVVVAEKKNYPGSITTTMIDNPSDDDDDDKLDAPPPDGFRRYKVNSWNPEPHHHHRQPTPTFGSCCMWGDVMKRFSGKDKVSRVVALGGRQCDDWSGKKRNITKDKISL